MKPPLPPRRRFETFPIHYFFLEGFLVIFFLVCLGGLLLWGFVTGRPLFPPSRMASKSSSLYMPADPIYLYGFRSYLWSLLFTASDDMPSSWAISSTVKSLIPINIPVQTLINQEVNAKMSKLLDILLYVCIVKNQKFLKIFKKFFQNLDYPTGRGYIPI